MRKRRLGQGAFAAVVAGAGALGVHSATAERAEARWPFDPCICPMVYAPVICSNGYVYSNACFAGCDGATGCVPYEITF